jgi:hypothetical protein
MVIFVQVTEEKLARISILGVKSNVTASSILAVIDNCEVCFIAELKCVISSCLEWKGVGILAQGLGFFLTPHKDKVQVFGCSDEAVVWCFSRLLFGGDHHGSELFFDGRWGLLGRRQQFLGSWSSTFGHVGNGSSEGNDGSGSKDRHNDTERSGEGNCEMTGGSSFDMWGLLQD